ncbi:MAG: FAD-dependent oxidoreductase [Burkholderiales bacterium]|nr:FAD-dependent oxidoreductase [Opitutaceae bacterium]
MNASDLTPLHVHAGPAYDVVVMGGGVSGSIAAIAAARLGARTLLVEEQGYLGGSLTSMGVGPMMSFHNGAGQQLVLGLPEELIVRLQKRGASPGHIPDTTTYCSTVTPFDSEELKIELETMLAEAGGEILYHTQLAAVVRAGDRIGAVVVCNKAGLTTLTAKTFIDSTGDGDLASRAGATFQRGRERDGVAQPMTMNLKVGNVDTAALRAYVEAHPEDFNWPHGAETGLARLRVSPRVCLGGFKKAWTAARAAGEVEVPRDDVLFFETATPGVIIVNTSRVQGLEATNPYELSRAEAIGRRQCAQIFAFLRKHAAGFAHAIRMDTAPKIGVRESRHIAALYQITAEDLVHERVFSDPIALGGYPIDIHSPSGAQTNSVHLRPEACYQIPLRSLLVAEPANLVVVGRCIGATHEAAAAFRVTPIAMAIGQAGGVTAALAARPTEGRAPDVAYDQVRTALLAQGAKLPS